MNTVTTKISALAFGVVFAFAAITAPTANAGALEDQIAALLAQIAALQAQINGGSTTTTTGGSTTTTYVHPGVTQDFTTFMKIGSRGEEVKRLQIALNAMGYNVGAADGVFGPMTKSGVMAFQAAYGLTADGLVGPATRAELNKKTTTTVTPPTTGVTGDKLVISGLASDDLLVGPSQKVIFSKLTLEAGDEDVMVKDIKTELTGSADRKVISKVQLLDSAMLELDSDNVDSDWVTSITDNNWFEDYTLWDISQYKTLYKN